MTCWSFTSSFGPFYLTDRWEEALLGLQLERSLLEEILSQFILGLGICLSFIHSLRRSFVIDVPKKWQPNGNSAAFVRLFIPCLRAGMGKSRTGTHSRSYVCVNGAQLECWGLLQHMSNVQLPRGRQGSSSQPLCSCRDFRHCVCVILYLIIAPEGCSIPRARNFWVLARDSWGNGFPQILSALEDLYTLKRSF